MLEPLSAQAHNLAVLKTTARFETSLAKWSKVDGHLKGLAVMAAAARLGCEWCMDFGYWVTATGGIAESKLQQLADWRDSDAFTPLERLVIEYAEAMSSTPIQVSDELTVSLREHLSEAQLVELTMMIAVENQRSRFNSALGLGAQGFKDRCELPSIR